MVRSRDEDAGATGGEGGAGGSVIQTAAITFVDESDEVVDRLRYGEPFAVIVDGLAPGTEVTLESSVPAYEGWATFIVGDSGVVDTRIDAPTAGTYDGVEPEGLLWSMERVSDDFGSDFDVDIAAVIDGEPAGSATLERGSERHATHGVRLLVWQRDGGARARH